MFGEKNGYRPGVTAILGFVGKEGLERLLRRAYLNTFERYSLLSRLNDDWLKDSTNIIVNELLTGCDNYEAGSHSCFVSLLLQRFVDNELAFADDEVSEYSDRMRNLEGNTVDYARWYIKNVLGKTNYLDCKYMKEGMLDPWNSENLRDTLHQDISSAIDKFAEAVGCRGLMSLEDLEEFLYEHFDDDAVHCAIEGVPLSIDSCDYYRNTVRPYCE